jgi:hypothetical protein
MVGSGDHHLLVLGKTACRVLDYGESLGKDFVENSLRLVVRDLLKIVDALVELFLLVDGHVVFIFDAFAQGSQLVLLLADLVADSFFEFYCLGTKLVIGKFFDSGIDFQCSFNIGIDLFKVALRLISKQFA